MTVGAPSSTAASGGFHALVRPSVHHLRRRRAGPRELPADRRLLRVHLGERAQAGGTRPGPLWRPAGRPVVRARGGPRADPLPGGAGLRHQGTEHHPAAHRGDGVDGGDTAGGQEGAPDLRGRPSVQLGPGGVDAGRRLRALPVQRPHRPESADLLVGGAQPEGRLPVLDGDQLQPGHLQPAARVPHGRRPGVPGVTVLPPGSAARQPGGRGGGTAVRAGHGAVRDFLGEHPSPADRRLHLLRGPRRVHGRRGPADAG